MVLREAPYPQEQVIAATIDIESLREHRSRCNHNTWVDVRTEGFRQIYEKPIYPPEPVPLGQAPAHAGRQDGPGEAGVRRPLRPRPVHPARRPERSRTCRSSTRSASHEAQRIGTLRKS